MIGLSAAPALAVPAAADAIEAFTAARSAVTAMEVPEDLADPPGVFATAVTLRAGHTVVARASSTEPEGGTLSAALRWALVLFSDTESLCGFDALNPACGWAQI